MDVSGGSLQENKKSGFYQCHTKISCGQNIKEGLGLPEPTESYLQALGFEWLES